MESIVWMFIKSSLWMLIVPLSRGMEESPAVKIPDLLSICYLDDVEHLAMLLLGILS